MRSRTTFVAVGALFLAATSLLGCSSDASSGTPGTTGTTGKGTTASSSASVETSATQASAATVPATESAPSQPASGGGDDGGGGDATCPDAASLAAAYGGEVELDAASAQTGAVGLVFCPYNEVLPPGATGAFGTEAIPDSFSITFTNQNITAAGAGGDPVDGLGERALWSDIGELSVWTGERGIIISLISPPGDAKATAIALAQAVL
jgi:hypothetical protein